MTEHARIAPLANLPLFHKLEGRKAVVVGSSEGAAWKAELLESAGAKVVRLDRWSAEDLRDVAIAVADLPERIEAQRFLAAARNAGAVANIIDQTDLCDVFFGTIVNRSPVVVAISTDGAAPVLGQSIRARIESVLPLGLSSWAKAAKEWRSRLKQRVASFSDRRAFWQRFAAKAWAQPDRSPLMRRVPDRCLARVAARVARRKAVRDATFPQRRRDGNVLGQHEAQRQRGGESAVL